MQTTAAQPPRKMKVQRGDIGADHSNFERMLEEDEKSGRFRRLIPLSEVGHDTPYVYWHPERPYFRIPKDPGVLDPES